MGNVEQKSQKRNHDEIVENGGEENEQRKKKHVFAGVEGEDDESDSLFI